MNVGIDLLWVRPGKNGGTESYIRNLLKGFCGIKDKDIIFVLFVSKDNCESFLEFNDYFETVKCPVSTNNFTKRVIWENFHLIPLGKKYRIDIWFFPVYSRPLFINGIKNVTVIHDLQALHYPSYFSNIRNIYFKITWAIDCWNSTIVTTISEFCKKDIESHYINTIGKIVYIHNPIFIKNETTHFDSVAAKYGIEKGKYYYTVSSLAKHKNLLTLIKAFKLLKDRGFDGKLLITGVKVNAANEVFDFVKENGLESNILYTGFISDEDRNALYDNCRTFLFPSVFEGFGMPPIEAMLRGVPVLTTKETSLYEVTEGKAYYIEKPYDETEWAEKIPLKYDGLDPATIKHISESYNVNFIATKYIELFKII